MIKIELVTKMTLKISHECISAKVFKKSNNWVPSVISISEKVLNPAILQGNPFDIVFYS
jgi:hypothetical protein